MLIGHQKQWQFLKKAAEFKKVPHGLLFYGPDHIGKKTVALEFIKLLNCQNPDFSQRPCQKCSSCVSLEKKQHPDLIFIEPSQNSKSVGVVKTSIQIPQIRELNRKLSLCPYSAPFKTAIIDRAHLINQQAQNCFLKTLEEPKGKTLLILVSEHPEILLPTIISRVQKIRFYPVKTEIIADGLERFNISQEKIKEILSFSRGKPGLALNFLLEPQSLENLKTNIFKFNKINNLPLAVRFQYAKILAQKPESLKEILDSWLIYFRNVFLLKSGADYNSHLMTFSPNPYSLPKIKKIIRVLEGTRFLVSTTNVNPRLALELLLMEF